jgi:hypothetical protein
MNKIVENNYNHSPDISQYKHDLIKLNAEIAQTIENQNCKQAIKACHALENALKASVNQSLDLHPKVEKFPLACLVRARWTKHKARRK